MQYFKQLPLCLFLLLTISLLSSALPSISSPSALRRSSNATDTSSSTTTPSNRGEIIYHEVHGWPIYLKITLGGNIPSPLILKNFLNAMAGESFKYVNQEGEHTPCADLDKDPWVQTRREEGYQMDFFIASSPRIPQLISWGDVLHTLDGLNDVLKERPHQLTERIQIQEKGSGTVIGTAKLSMVPVWQASTAGNATSNATIAQTAGVPCRGTECEEVPQTA